MKLLLTTILFFLIGTCSKAQDTSLPKGESQIYLLSGKIIKPVILWRIDTIKLEFVRDGNLDDKRISDILKIETLRCTITFDEKNHMVKKNLDMIILYPQDSIWGLIKKADESTITFLPAGSNTNEKIKRKNVINILQSDGSSGFPSNKTTEIAKNETVPLDETAVITMSSTSKIPEPMGMKESSMKKQDSIPVYASIQETGGKENVKQGRMNNSNYEQSYLRGVHDANLYYKGYGPMAGTAITTVIFPPIGLLEGVVSAAVEPNVHNWKVSDLKLMEDENYVAGYKNQAHKRRQRKCSWVLELAWQPL